MLLELRKQRITLIREAIGNRQPFDMLHAQLATLSQAALSEELSVCGVIPEEFDHDSSEEKLWAKYCDILLKHALSFLGIQTQVIRTRGNSADVRGETDFYSLVGDAKAFRLSRTARNQKDFKIAALDDWRSGSTYACLVAPLYQFPSRTSQIYKQALEKNVTLLGYVHLKFLLDHMPNNSLQPMWDLGTWQQPTAEAQAYWHQLEAVLVGLAGQSVTVLETYKRSDLQAASQIGSAGIQHWQRIIQDYQKLTREEAITRLRKAEKVDQKIQAIEKTLQQIGINP